MNKFLNVILIVAGILFASCEADSVNISSRLPVFYGFTMTWDNDDAGTLPGVGELVTLTAVQKERGKYLYNVNYNWTITTAVNGNDSVYTRCMNAVYDMQPEDPKIKFIIPQGNDGRLSVRLVAEYDFSVNKVDEPTMATQTQGYKGTFSYTVSNTINGKASGNAMFEIGN